MRLSTWWVSVVILMFMFILFNCGKQKPLPTGYEDIFGDKEGKVADTVLVQQPGTEIFYSRLINTGSALNLLLGNHQNYHSAIYLKFNLPDSAQIHSAKLTLTRSRFDSTLAQNTEPFFANLYQAQYEWENDQDPEQYLDQLPFDSQPFQTWTIQSDTSNKIIIELDTVIVTQWSDSSSGVPNYGFWIDAPEAKRLDYFYSSENVDFSQVPQLELIYTVMDSAGPVRDTTTIGANKDAYLFLNSENDLNLNQNYFYIGKGFVFRSFLKFDFANFDTTIHVSRALLKLVINKANSIDDAAGIDDMVIYRVADESWQKNEVDESPNTRSYTGTLIDSTVTLDVTPTVQGWIGQNYSNYGFLVRSRSETQSLARVAFYSTVSSEEFQPRLYLYFTLPPKQEF